MDDLIKVKESKQANSQLNLEKKNTLRRFTRVKDEDVYDSNNYPKNL